VGEIKREKKKKRKKRRDEKRFYNEETNGKVNEGGVLSDSGLRVVGNVGEGKTTREPVVGAVFEEVENRHGGVAELVNKGSLKLPLDKVGNDHVKDHAVRMTKERKVSQLKVSCTSSVCYV
jgi:hypothetical protein